MRAKSSKQRCPALCLCDIIVNTLIKVLPGVLHVYVWLIFLLPVYFMYMFG